MTHSASETASLMSRYYVTITKLQELLGTSILQARAAGDSNAQQYLRFGVGRRLNVLTKCITNIYGIFPPSQERPLEHDARDNVQISLHAYVINLFGVFDNWAWAFLFRHGFANQFERRQVGLFKTDVKALLPKELRDYLDAPRFTEWRNDYLINYRDALAHRIPVYIPPAIWTSEETERWNVLETEKGQCISAHEWDRVDAIYAEQDALGTPCFGFIHEFSEGEILTTVGLHSQLLLDARAVIEFGNLFYQHWHTSAGDLRRRS